MTPSFQKIARISFLHLGLTLLALGCASSGPLNGVNAKGEKVYLGPVPIENTQPYQEYLPTQHTEVDKQRFLFRRLKEATDLEFFQDGAWYNSIQAYRGGMWLMRERYQKGQDTRTFIKKYVDRSDAGQLHLARYPDGSTQLGSAVLLNELDLLEKTSEGNAKK